MPGTSARAARVGRLAPAPAALLALTSPRVCAPPSRNHLEELLRERAAIEPLRVAVPVLWALLDAEIARVGASVAGAAPGADRAAALMSAGAAGKPAAAAARRRQVRLPVPADKFPEYNFVGRLLGPRGTTLKTLERETGCKIMIRGKGSIRKDRECDVRGRAGWEHVFNEPLHVVIEVGEGCDDATATRALMRAKEHVEELLVPVPEERDGLKRQQLRALAIMNGTYRGAPSAGKSHESSTPAHRPGALHRTASAPTTALYGLDVLGPGFLGDSVAAPSQSPSPVDQSSLHLHFQQQQQHQHRQQQPYLQRQQQSFPLRQPQSHHAEQQQQPFSPYGTAVTNGRSLPVPVLPSGRRTPSSGGTSPRLGARNNSGDVTALTAKMARVTVPDEFNSSSVGDDSPESSRSSVDEDANTSGQTVPAIQQQQQQNSAACASPTLSDMSLGVGGFLGQGFYNGAFSNCPSPSPWDRPSTPASASLFGTPAVPSTEVLTTSSTTITSLGRHNAH